MSGLRKIHKDEVNDLSLKKRELIHIEFLRIIATYLVLFNHTGTKGYFLFSIARDSSLYWIYLFISIADKVAVPLFFMISGALLLGKEESIADIYRKRVAKFIIILIVISFCYEGYNWYFNNADFNIKGCLLAIYSKKASTALWYLYSYIGVLVMLPFLRRLAKSMSNKDYIYLASAQFVIVGFVPIVEYVFSKGTISLNTSFSVSIITAMNIFYLLMGYYVEKVLEEKYFSFKNVCIGMGVSFFVIVIACFMTNYRAVVMGECNEGVSQAFHNSFIAVPAMTIYFGSKYLFANIKITSFAKKLIQFFGGTTFGIYLMEKMLRERTEFIFEYLKPMICTLPACVIWIAAACLIGAFITAILKKIPIIKNYL